MDRLIQWRYIICCVFFFLLLLRLMVSSIDVFVESWDDFWVSVDFSSFITGLRATSTRCCSCTIQGSKRCTEMCRCNARSMVQTLYSHLRLIAVWVGLGFWFVAYLVFLFLCGCCRYAKRQVHASLDDGSVNHATVRDMDFESKRLEKFTAELEAEWKQNLSNHSDLFVKMLYLVKKFEKYSLFSVFWSKMLFFIICSFLKN